MTTRSCSRTRACRLYLGLELALGSLLMSGCDGGSGFALSLQPFYTSADSEVNQGLEGAWTTKEGDLTFCFEQGEGKEYNAAVKETDGGQLKTAEFEVHLLRLGATWFLDFLPKSEPGGSEFYLMHLFRAHSIARVELSQDTLQMTFFDGRWLEKKIDEKSVDVSYQKTDGTVLLTGTSEEVQDFLFLHSNDDAAFSDPIALTRPEVQP